MCRSLTCFFFAFLFYLLLYRALFILKASAQQHKENKNNIYCIIYNNWKRRKEAIMSGTVLVCMYV
jgi:hypothetical protein